jgi:hypothetical protein
MSKPSDIEINCAVRRVLVRHWIDIGKISLRTTQGVVWLSGTLCKLPRVSTELTSKMIVEILGEIRRSPAVRRVHPEFNNWAEREGGWQLITEKSASTPGEIRHPALGGTVDLTGWEDLPEKVEATGKGAGSSP